MPRIKLTVPERFSFSAEIPVRITDLNYGGHVGNDAILSLIHEARMQYLKHFDYTEMNFCGASLIMNDVAIEFKSELFYGDTVKVYVAAIDFSKVGFDVFYKMVKNKEEILVAHAKTGMVCFDYQKRKITAIPEEAKKQLGE
jgi:YbgC/YbaW family acyl-CoA thioester hydrolase